MLYQIADWSRKLSLIVVLVGCLAGFFTEITSDVPIGRNGKPKGPLWKQRATYCILIATGIPGLIWAIYRTATEKQKTLWE